MGDFNGDGKQDLAIARGTTTVENVGILLGDGAGHFTAAPFVTAAIILGPSPSAILMATENTTWLWLNRGSNDVSILLGNGTGGFTLAGNFPAGPSPRQIFVSDFNGDGKQDLALSLGDSFFDPESRNIAILIGNGTGGFSAAQSFPYRRLRIRFHRRGFKWRQ